MQKKNKRKSKEACTPNSLPAPLRGGFTHTKKYACISCADTQLQRGEAGPKADKEEASPPPTRESSAQKMPFKNLHRRRRAPETKWDLPPRRQRIQRARTHKRTTPLIRHSQTDPLPRKGDEWGWTGVWSCRSRSDCSDGGSNMPWRKPPAAQSDIFWYTSFCYDSSH